MVFTRILRTIIKKGITSILDRIILSLPVYYTSLEKISIKKCFQVISGQRKSLYKVRFISYIPDKFDEIILDMLFELDHLNTDMLQKEAELAILRSIAVRTKSKVVEFQADVLANELKRKKEKKNKEKMLTLNDFIDYIEIAFNRVGTIDPDKLTASRAFSLFHKAIEQNERISKLYK